MATASQSLDLLIAFTGGGLLAALLSWVRLERSGFQARSHDLARMRLEKLYGPLLFLTQRNVYLLEHVSSIHKATEDELVNKNWAQDERTRAHVSSSITQSIDIANSYVAEVRRNNSRIVELLESQYAYIYQDDSAVFQRVALAHSRMEMEYPIDSGLALPFEVYKALGPLHFLHPDLNRCAQDRVLSLQESVAK